MIFKFYSAFLIYYLAFLRISPAICFRLSLWSHETLTFLEEMQFS